MRSLHTATREQPSLTATKENSMCSSEDPVHPKDAGKDGRQKEKRVAEDEMVGWHHQLDGHESEQAPGVGDGQGSLACCSAQGCKASNTI